MAQISQPELLTNGFALEIDSNHISKHTPLVQDILIPGRISLSEVRWSLSAPAARSYLADFVGWNRPLHAAQGGLAASPET